MKVLKYGVNFGLFIIVVLYTAFALTMLWDWFVTTAFHVSEIGYWNAYGLVLIIRLLSPQTETAMAEQWGRAMRLLEACLPEDKRAQVLEAVDKEKLSTNTHLLIANGMAMAGITTSLVIGWVVHTFLT